VDVAAVSFLQALAELSAAAFDDALTGGVRELAAAIARGEAPDVGARLDPIRGALLNRIRIAVDSPTRERLRRLWVVVGYGRAELQAELEARARAWIEARASEARARAVDALRTWFRMRESAISRALRGPFRPL
jgi:hypothetical protein